MSDDNYTSLWVHLWPSPSGVSDSAFGAAIIVQVGIQDSHSLHTTPVCNYIVVSNTITKGVMDKQINYTTLIGVHLTMHLMHPN